MNSIFSRDICRFVPFHNDSYSMQTINFVLETKPQSYSSLKPQSVYKMHLVCNGKGKLHIMGRILPLSEGDVFFTFPAVPFCIESVEDFSYMYISFLGARANMIMDNLNISSKNFLFSNCQEMSEFWRYGISSNSESSDLITESVLLYSFHFLSNKLISSKEKNDLNGDLSLKTKKYIDDNFAQKLLSLNVLSAELSYSPKYISSTFKKKFNIGIAEYLNTIRIQNACTLMHQGFTSISDISDQCGFSDPEYFSKKFKQKIGESPKSYIKKMDL